MLLLLLLAPGCAEGGGALVDTPPAAADTAPADTGAADDTGDPVDSGEIDSGGGDSGADSAQETGDTGEPVEAPCLDRLLRANGFADTPDYLATGAVINADCTGTNHQDIRDVERVVFLGDSITVGSPPNTVEQFYRSQLTDWLVATYGLEAPEYLWYWYDVFNGTGYMMDSGDFAVCAKWGARTDDLVEDNDQVVDCIPEDKAGLTTLVVMTTGGNDLFSLADDYYAGVPPETLREQTESEARKLRDAVTWITTDKTRFPGRMYVVFANVYEFTDGMGDVDACPGADMVGYHYDLGSPGIEELLAYTQQEYLQIAVDTQTDMIFMGEAFCGHGYNRDDASGRCYRDPAAELWFDESCFHPNNTGHGEIAKLFSSTITW
jgi:lysophospholipase L1-like esterase